MGGSTGQTTGANSISHGRLGKEEGGGTVGTHPMLTMLAENNKFVINALRGDLSTINVRLFSVPQWMSMLADSMFFKHSSQTISVTLGLSIHFINISSTPI